MKNKNKSKFKIIGISILSLTGLVLLAGFIFPGLIWQKSLGITYSAVDYKNANEKFVAIQNDIDNRKDGIEYEFTQEELTAYMNEINFSFLSLSNGEIRLNNDGTMEISAKVNIDFFLSDVLGGKYTKESLEKDYPAFGILPDPCNLYIKFNGSLLNNQITLTIITIQVQGITVPEKYYNPNDLITNIINPLNNTINDYNSNNNVNFKSITNENGLIKVNVETK